MSNQDYDSVQLISHCSNLPRCLERLKKKSFYLTLHRLKVKTMRIESMDDRNFSQIEVCPARRQAILITPGQLEWTITMLQMLRLEPAEYLLLERGMWPLVFQSQGQFLLHESTETRSTRPDTSKKIDLYKLNEGSSPEKIPLLKEDRLVSSLNSKSDRLRVFCIVGGSIFFLNYSGFCRYHISNRSTDTLINFASNPKRTAFGAQENIFGMAVAHRYSHELVLLTNLTGVPSEYIVRKVRVADAYVSSMSVLRIGGSKRINQLAVMRDSILLSFSKSNGAEYRLYDLSSLDCTDTLPWTEKSSYNRTQDELFHFTVRRCEFVFLDVVKEKNVFYLQLAGLYRGKFHQVLSRIDHSFCKSHLQLAKQIYSTSVRSVCLVRNLDDNRLYTWWRWEIMFD
jgi:hypothetical protein